jgi:hypothetical protein
MDTSPILLHSSLPMCFPGGIGPTSPATATYSLISFFWNSPAMGTNHSSLNRVKNSPFGGISFRPFSSQAPHITYTLVPFAFAPYSRIGPPHLPQNSRWRRTPEPLSASWTMGWVLLVIRKPEDGNFVVVPYGPPKNF